MQQPRQSKQGTVPMESLLPFNALNAEQQDALLQLTLLPPPSRRSQHHGIEKAVGWHY